MMVVMRVRSRISCTAFAMFSFARSKPSRVTSVNTYLSYLSFIPPTILVEVSHDHAIMLASLLHELTSAIRPGGYHGSVSFYFWSSVLTGEENHIGVLVQRFHPEVNLVEVEVGVFDLLGDERFLAAVEPAG